MSLLTSNSFLPGLGVFVVFIELPGINVFVGKDQESATALIESNCISIYKDQCQDTNASSRNFLCLSMVG